MLKLYGPDIVNGNINSNTEVSAKITVLHRTSFSFGWILKVILNKSSFTLLRLNFQQITIFAAQKSDGSNAQKSRFLYSGLQTQLF